MSQIPRSSRGGSRNLREGLRVLEWLSRHPDGAGVRESAAALGLSSSSAHRFLETLAHRRWVQQSPETKKYSLGAMAVQAGVAALERLDLVKTARPALQLLAARTGETAYLGVLAGDQIVYLDIESGGHVVGLNRRPGSILGAHCTAIGKVILSDLPSAALDRIFRPRLPRAGPRTVTTLTALRRQLAAVRAAGIAINDEESGDDVYSLAVPLRDWRGHVVAGLGIGGPRARMLPERGEWTALLCRQGAALSAALGYGGDPSRAARARRGRPQGG